MTQSPLRAMNLLKSIPNPKSLPEKDFAAWCLQYTRVLNKQDSVIRTDSVIKIAVNYYEGTSLDKYKGMSRYLLGCIYENNFESELAMNEFKIAESYFLKENEVNYLGLVYYHLGYLYSMDEYYEKAATSFKASHEHFRKIKNINNEAYAIREIAFALDNAGRNLSTVVGCYNMAQKYALNAHDTANYHDISFYYATTLINKTTEFQRAKDMLLAAYHFDHESAYYHNALSMVYSKLNMADSAIYYFQESSSDTLTLEKKTASFLAGAYAEKANGNYIKSLNYCLLYDRTRNLLLAKNKQSKLYRIDKQYNLNEKNEENNLLKIDNRNKLIYLGLMIVVVLLVLIVMMVMQWKRKREKLTHEIEKQFLMSEIEKKRLSLLSKLQSRLDTSIRFEELKLKLPKDSSLKPTYVDELLKQFVLTEVEWQMYVDEVNLIFDNFLDHLSLKFSSLTIADKIVLALISLQLDITSTCSILGISKNTMYRRRNTIKERLKLDKAVDLESWVMEIIGKIDK